MKKGFTLVEMLVVTAVFSIILMIVIVLTGNINNFMRFSKIFDESFDQINFSSRVVGIVQDVVNRFGRNPDEITLTPSEISGKIYVLGDSVDASLKIEGETNNDKYVSRIVLETPNERKTLMEVPNASLSFEWADPVSEELGAVISMTIERWSDEDPINGRVVRRVFIPLLNVR